MELGKNASLPTNMCLLLEISEDKIDCSVQDPSQCIQCRVLGKYLTGESLQDTGSAGHIICIFIWMLTCLVGILGLFGNSFIICVIRRQKRGTPFDSLLIALAAIDLICCGTSLVPSTSAILYFQKIRRNVFTLYGVWLGSHTILFVKSASSFLTVFITAERFVAVAFPLKARQYLGRKLTYFMILAAVIIGVSFAIPRYSSQMIVKTDFGRDIEATQHLDYLIVSSTLHDWWYLAMKGYYNQVDFWLPLPLLVLFNGLTYYYVRKHDSRRNSMEVSTRREISSAKMFFPVVIVLLLCNIEPIIHYALIRYEVIYRELQMFMYLSFACNSAANLSIYCYRSCEFRRQANSVLSKRTSTIKSWVAGSRVKSYTVHT